jgi:EAL and modified HD-GYP domain-containing signal transduction protein
LTVRVLRTVNSASVGLSQRVSSLRQAVLLLGPRALLGCVLVAGVEAGTQSTRESTDAALIRARMCELIAPRLGIDPGAAFTVGLINSLEAVLGQPLFRVLAELPVSEEVEEAVLARRGPLGEVLAVVAAYESAQPTVVDLDVLRSVFVDAVCWTRRITAKRPDEN